ncbi:MAG: hypothetical protein GX437_00045 [Sphingobacteriales bacterium]|nr:hypothetical protein [Sphingobacteriales bacterium]
MIIHLKRMMYFYSMKKYRNTLYFKLKTELRRPLLLLITVLISFCAYSQTGLPADTVLPKKVLSTFTKMYPQGNTDDWMVSGDTFTITYFTENQWFEVMIGRGGNWIGTSEITDYDRLPEAVRKSFNQSGYVNNEIFIVKFEEKQGPKKKIKIRNWLIYTDDGHGNEVILKFDENGNPLP